jgi:hypothetical protein
LKHLSCLVGLSLSLGLACGISNAATLKYQPIVNISTAAITPHYFAIGDFNGDGKPDLAVPDFSGKTISIYLYQGAGNFSSPTVTTISIDNGLGAIISGDFNGDGKSDIVVGTFSGDQAAIVLLGNGDGTFAVQPPIAGSFGFLSGKVADFNGDGHLDLFLGGNGMPYLFLGKGDGAFSQGTISPGSFPGGAYFGISAGDFNGDKKLDGIATNLGNPGTALGSIVFFPGDGNSTLGPASAYQPALFLNPQSVDVADLNHDGKLDLLFSGNGAAAGALGNGDGTFQLETNQLIPIFAQDDDPNKTSSDDVIVLAQDLDRDGHPDAIVLDCTTGLVSLALNDGTGAFPPTLNTPYTYQFSTDSYAVASADFNGDGLPDIAVSNAAAKTVSLLLSVKSLAKPTVGLSSSGSSALVGSALTFKTAITGGTPIATGTVSLMDGSFQIAQQTLDASASAVFDVSDLTVGVHTLTMTYSGDTNYASGTSAALSQSVTDFQVALTTASQTVTAGTTASYPLTVSPQAGFTGDVTFSCSGLPSLSTCTAPALTAGATPATETVTISTTASTTAQNRMPGGTSYACVLLGCLSLWGLARSNGKSAKRFLMLLPIFCVLGLGPLACGGASKRTIPGTPSGTSTITITATTTQNGITVTHNATATLIVQ